MMGEIREAAVSGTFYPGNPDVLRADIAGYLSKVPPGKAAGEVVGLIAPHAGYMYSGQTAAYGYKALAGSRYDTVIILAPSHRSFFVGAAVQHEGAYRTPLGLVPIDEGLARALMGAGDMVHGDSRVHQGEHAVEVQLPFLQSMLPAFKIVPLIMGDGQDPESSLRLSALIHEAIREREGRYLIVGSTDLSHYYPYDLAKEIDKVAVDLLERFDLDGMTRELATGKYEACGAGAMIAAMALCAKLGARESKVLHYANSGDVTGDMSGVVGYVSCVFYRGK